MFDNYVAYWDLIPDGEPVVTHSSRLLPVRYRQMPAMLKVAVHPEEKSASPVMQWWDGEGAAPVLARNGDALLLERALGTRSLSEMARGGRDDEATRIICATVCRLHATRRKAPPMLTPLSLWFRDLAHAASGNEALARANAIAENLLATQGDICVLHGDIHHDNILDFGDRGWLAIDPKGLIGERSFDYANLFCNPDLATAADRVRFCRRLAVVCEMAGLERNRMLRWIVAWAGLSASWWLGDGMSAETDFAIAGLAAAELAETGG